MKTLVGWFNRDVLISAVGVVFVIQLVAVFLTVVVLFKENAGGRFAIAGLDTATVVVSYFAIEKYKVAIVVIGSALAILQLIAGAIAM